MNSEVINVMIAKIETDDWQKEQREETDDWQKEQREEAGLLDSQSGRSELILGWATIRDFSNSQVLERLLMYEKRIESSLYKAMNELQKLQRLREKEEAEAAAASLAQPSPSLRDEAATHRGRDAHETQGRDALATEAATRSEHQADQMKKQSQIDKTGTKWQRHTGT